VVRGVPFTVDVSTMSTPSAALAVEAAAHTAATMKMPDAKRVMGSLLTMRSSGPIRPARV
jgi:hypothetical protein